MAQADSPLYPPGAGVDVSSDSGIRFGLCHDAAFGKDATRHEIAAALKLNF